MSAFGGQFGGDRVGAEADHELEPGVGCVVAQSAFEFCLGGLLQARGPVGQMPDRFAVEEQVLALLGEDFDTGGCAVAGQQLRGVGQFGRECLQGGEPAP